MVHRYLTADDVIRAGGCVDGVTEQRDALKREAVHIRTQTQVEVVVIVVVPQHEWLHHA